MGGVGVVERVALIRGAKLRALNSSTSYRTNKTKPYLFLSGSRAPLSHPLWAFDRMRDARCPHRRSRMLSLPNPGTLPYLPHTPHYPPYSRYALYPYPPASYFDDDPLSLPPVGDHDTCSCKTHPASPCEPLRSASNSCRPVLPPLCGRDASRGSYHSACPTQWRHGKPYLRADNSIVESD